MLLKREVIDPLMSGGVTKFVLIGENVLNFHHSDDAYYEEWFDEVVEDDGWIALLNFREHVLADMQAIDLDSYFVLGGELNDLDGERSPQNSCADASTIAWNSAGGCWAKSAAAWNRHPVAWPFCQASHASRSEAK